MLITYVSFTYCHVFGFGHIYWKLHLFKEFFDRQKRFLDDFRTSCHNLLGIVRVPKRYADMPVCSIQCLWELSCKPNTAVCFYIFICLISLLGINSCMIQTRRLYIVGLLDNTKLPLYLDSYSKIRVFEKTSILQYTCVTVHCINVYSTN